MRGRLRIPNSAEFDDSCTNKLKYYLCNYILKKQ